MRAFWLVLLGLSVVNAQELTLDALERRGERTLLRFQRDPAVIGFQVPGTEPRTRIEGKLISSPPDFELRLLMFRPGKAPARLLTLVQSEGHWHVDEPGGVKGRYRPYEAPLALASAYRYLEEAWPPTYRREAGDALRGTDGEFAEVARTYRGGQRRKLEGALRDMRRSLAEEQLESEARRRVRSRASLIESLLEEGYSIYVDLETGTLPMSGREGFPVRYTTLAWPQQPPQLEMPQELPDRTKPLGSNLVQIGHDPRWTPKQGGRASIEGHLLDLDTLELRRIPHRGAEVGPGCFIEERRSLVVLGYGRERALVRIDLADGSSTILGKGTFDPKGLYFCPALSPDGRELALLYSGEQESLLSFRLHLVDLADGTARAVGEAFDGHSLSWLPDGIGLIAVRRTRVGGGVVKSIVKLALDGSVDVLREGDFAQVCGAPGKERILFKQEDDLFYTCDLSGDDVQRLGDGFPGHGFPAVGPGGRRAIFMRFSPTAGPRPVIVDLDEQTATSIEVGPGAWGMPAWR